MFQVLGIVPSSECSYLSPCVGTERPLSVTNFYENTHGASYCLKGHLQLSVEVKGQRVWDFISRGVYLFRLGH